MHIPFEKVGKEGAEGTRHKESFCAPEWTASLPLLSEGIMGSLKLARRTDV